jgi:hypothetical protein
VVAKASTIKRNLLALSYSLLVFSSGMLTVPAFAKKQHASVPADVQANPYANTAGVAKPDPEILLLGVYKELGANNLRQAQMKADALVEAYPTFRLGQLIRGDLLQLHTRPITTFGSVVNGPEDKLKNLREEAVARLKSLRERPDPNLVPRSILQLRDDQKYALVVDAKRSRLYVYATSMDK